MSVCRKLPDGTIQKIAGHTISLDANASEVRQGTWSLTGSSGGISTQITFTDPMPDTDYIVVVEPSADRNWGNPGPEPIGISNKTTTGFKLSSYTFSSVTTFTGTYTAFKLVKIEGYTALQNKVNNPDDTPTIDSMNLVTSDGVARAIENASAVWKGTKAEWNALPAADKLKYDLAVLLDETLVKAVDREDGTETDVANLNKIFRGTEAEWNALTDDEKNKYDVAHILDNMSGMYLNMPVGVVLPYMGAVAPIGWMLCDGQEFDPTEYPKLSAVLTEAGLDGTHTPDMRECALVGAGQNDTDTIATHDVYTLGQFKDDQIQNITGNVGTRNGGASGAFAGGGGATSGSDSEGWTGVNFNASRVARTGTVTRGKRKGVNYIICAK